MRQIFRSLSTLEKMRIARIASAVISSAVKITGNDPRRYICSRQGVNWELDLDQVIDLSVFLTGGFENSSFKLLRARLNPRFCFIDVGANIGAYALRLARFGGPDCRVYAIEPTGWAFEKLGRNLSLNPDLKKCVLPFQMGLMLDQTAKPQSVSASWSLSRLPLAESALGSEEMSVEHADFLSLDEFVERQKLKKIDGVKIDIDGLDFNVLESGRKTIEKFKPLVLFEYCPHLWDLHRVDNKAANEYFAQIDYDLINLRGEKFDFENSKCLEKVPYFGGTNLLGLHRSQL